MNKLWILLSATLATFSLSASEEIVEQVRFFNDQAAPTDEEVAAPVVQTSLNDDEKKSTFDCPFKKTCGDEVKKESPKKEHAFIV